VIVIIYNEEHHNLFSVSHTIWQKNQRRWRYWSM